MNETFRHRHHYFFSRARQIDARRYYFLVRRASDRDPVGVIRRTQVAKVPVRDELGVFFCCRCCWLLLFIQTTRDPWGLDAVVGWKIFIIDLKKKGERKRERKRISVMDSASITNYDVLVEPPIPGKSGDYQLDKHKNHVGNNRLGVFLNLHRPGYDSAWKRSDMNECNNIVDKIFNTVCEQCVPRGRFLVSSSPNGNGDDSLPLVWNQMDEISAKTFLRSVLQPTETTTTTNTNTSGTDQAEDSEEKKRRRRSSLLRRSASESLVGMVLDSKKKLSKFQTQEEPTAWKSHRNGGVTLKRMDVILTKSGNALDPNSQSVGNNRLHILVAMQSSKYQQAVMEGKEAIVNEVITTVNMFWKGRFLKEGGDGYEELSKEEARDAVRSIFYMRAGQSLPKRSSLPAPTLQPFNTAMPLPMRGVSLSGSIPTSLPSINTNLQPGSGGGGGNQSSAAIMNSGPAVNIPEVEGLRAAAVDQLKKKKARQTIANRIEHKGRRNVPPMVNAFGQNPSPPIAFGPPVGVGGVGGGHGPKKRQSTILGKLDPTLMNQLVSDFDEADFNDDDISPDPLPPTYDNKFGSQFSQGGGF